MNRKSYVLHFRPRSVSLSALRLTYTWGLGGATATLVFLLLVTGVMLKFVYIPTPEKAFATISALQRTVPFGRFVRNIHFWSANVLIVTVFLHMLRVFFTGAYKHRQMINWVIGLVLLGLILGTNFTGYLLPWDQLAYWAVTVCAAVLDYLPGIGPGLREMLIGGQELGPATLSHFFALHTAIIPAVLIPAASFHFWRIRKAGGLAVSQTVTAGPQDPEPQIEVIPHLMVREMAMAAMVTALVVLLAALWDAPLGAEANPGLSPNPTKAPWYFAGLQEMLLHLHPLLAVAVIPLLVIGGLLVLPFLPYSIEKPGAWFGSPRGRNTAAWAALAGILVTPAWILGHAFGPNLPGWLAPILGLAALAAVYGLVRYVFHGTSQEAVQAVFTFLLVVFVLLTLNGIWFRGASMALAWPWE